ncbi:MAG TPA: serine/threonine-protein kinase [Pirellulales bacterium]|nr:serine/threonine-protein kinase [Pirellulales bacterium]
MNRQLHARAKEIFHEAAQLAAGDRTGYLEATCGADTTLRVEVESLLKYHQPRTILAAVPLPAPPADDDAAHGKAIWGGPGTRRRMFRQTAGSLVSALGPRGQVALGALVAIVGLALVGRWVHAGTRSELRQMLADKLTALLGVSVAALELWGRGEKAKAESWARDGELVSAVTELLKWATPGAEPRDDLVGDPHAALIRKRLTELAGDDVQYAVWNRDRVKLADASPEGAGVGHSVTATGGALLTRVFQGETLLRMPHAGEQVTKDYQPETDRPTLAWLTPLRDHLDGKVVAALLVRRAGAEDELRDILSHARTGRTGEAYAFDRDGLMLTESRFNQQLMAAGLIPDAPDAHSAATVQIRDPGGDLTRGHLPARPLAARPLTWMASHAVAGENGFDLDGYRDYRGVTVVGAWKWLPAHAFGVATEVDYEEAYAPLWYRDVAFGIGLALLGVASAVILQSWTSIARLRREVRASRRLGQYTLKEQIGEGGMAQVFRASHAMLKRPTAVKLLKPGQATPMLLARFEREVQLASQLSHPNTIEIYDYGRTPEGTFFYAMEYLPGITLAQLVRLHGALPPARAVYLLKQVCRSLGEAHGLGLAHRDIKPQNIMVCQRGGDADVIKVLDFGLVKSTATDAGQELSRTFVAGTPLYMAPERLLDPATTDLRSDLYSLGAVAFWLVVGQEVFTGDNVAAIFDHVLHTPSPSAAQRAEQPVPDELDRLISACLAKKPDDRPANVACVLETLETISHLERWGQREAQAWWDTHAEQVQSLRT